MPLFFTQHLRTLQAEILCLVCCMGIALSGCGFHLRQEQPILITPLFIDAPEQQVFARMLRRALGEHSEVKLTSNVKEAKYRLKLISEGLERSIQALSTGGRVREVTLKDRISFQVLTQEGEEVLAPTQLVVERVLSYDDRFALAKVNDEAQVYKEMQEDGIRLLIMRLNALRPVVSQGNGEQK